MPIVSLAGERAGLRFLSTEDFIDRVSDICDRGFLGAGIEPSDRNIRPLRPRNELL